MKKSILIIIAVIACLAMATSAVLAAEFTSTSSTVLGSVVFTPSTSVTVQALATDNTDATNPNQYCVTSWHGAAINQSSGLQYAAISGGGANANTAIVTKTLNGVVASAVPKCTVVTAWPSGFAAN